MVGYVKTLLSVPLCSTSHLVKLSLPNILFGRSFLIFGQISVCFGGGGGSELVQKALFIAHF